MATTKAKSLLIYKDGTLHTKYNGECQFFDVVLLFSDGKPSTIGELSVEKDFERLLERVCDKWYGIL